MSNITEKSYIKVKWEGTPEEFTKEKQARIKAYAQNKYGCKNVIVQFNPITENGKQYTLDQSENIYDLANQRKLIEQFIGENKIDVNIDDIMRLDDKVNDKMKQQKDVDFTYRKLKIKHIWFGPFLSFGPDNEFPIEDLQGLTVVNSIPHNFGGKTTATVDLILYLFFNKTTKSKRDFEVFNIYLPDADEVKVKGLIEINGVEFIIERSITRKGKNNTTNSKLRIAKLVNGVEENLSEEQRRESEKVIVDTIGTYEDFLLTIISTGGNLEDLIEQKPTDRGNLLTRFIGLDIIKEKEGICKEIKTEWEKTIKSNQHNLIDLVQEIEVNRSLVTETELAVAESITKLEVIVSNIREMDLTKEVLIGKKKPIDDTLLGVDIEEEKVKFNTILENGKTKKAEYQALKDEFKTRVKPEYDEQGHLNSLQREKDLVIEVHDQKTIISNKEKEIVTLERADEKEIQDKEKEIVELERSKDKTIQEKETEIVTIERENERAIQEKEKTVITYKMEHASNIKAKEKEVTDLETVIKNLKEGEICPTCKRKFDDCDHSETISAHEKTIEKIKKEIEKLNKNGEPRVKPLQDEIDGLKKLEDPKIITLRGEITVLKETELPEIKVIQEQIKKLKETENPGIKTISDQIKTINDVTIPFIEGQKIAIAEEIEKFKKQYESLNQYEKDEIKIDRLSVEVKGLGQDYKDQDELIKRYEQNVLSVDANKEIERQIIDVNFKMEGKNRERDTINQEKSANEERIKNYLKTIDDSEKLIKVINKEQDILKIFEHYLTIFGKKGITSLILKSAIPVINSELDRLLNDTATFSMELDLTSKNDVEYWMVDRETGLKKLVTSGSGYERTAAAIALRAVLTKISVLPKPDMIIFDEVLGKVADENLEPMKFLMDKVAELFDKVFLITHNENVKYWANNIITVVKENNISKLVKM